jgi:hypothetical protein
MYVPYRINFWKIVEDLKGEQLTQNQLFASISRSGEESETPKTE